MSKHDHARENNAATQRDAMLQELIASMQALHTRRRRRKRIGAMCILVAMLGGVMLLALPQHRTAEQPSRVQQIAEQTHEPEHHDKPHAEPRRVNIAIVSTDPDAVQRYAVGDVPRIVQIVNDDQLLASLAAVGRPTGLIRSENAVWLTAAVTDFEINLERP